MLHNTLRRSLHAPAWPVILAAMAALGLLMSFLLVVRESVAQGVTRRATSAAHDAASSRCRVLAGAQSRATCREQLVSAPAARPTPP